MIDSLSLSPIILINIDNEDVQNIKKMKGVRKVEENASIYVEPEVIEDKKKVNALNSKQQIPWGINTVNPFSFWNNNYTGKNVKVGVLDTGIDLDHPDLNVKGGVSFIKENSSFDDDNGHGTHVAGTIAAQNNDFGVVGVSPDVELYAIKVINKNNRTNAFTIIKGIEWAIENKMDILNLSLYLDNYNADIETLHDVIKEANAKNILIVACAGNTGLDQLDETIKYPAKYDEVIAVSASNSENNIATFSSYGKGVTLAAPGDAILSTYPNGQYLYMSGTSMATPHVTGALALLKQQYPNASNDELKNLLLSYATDYGDIGFDPYFGHGLLQLASPAQEDTATEEEVTQNENNSSQEILPFGIYFNRAITQLNVNDNLKLTALVMPSYGPQTKTWVSSNPSIISVDENGEVTAHRIGIATITATTINGLKDTLTLTVNADPKEKIVEWPYKENVRKDKKWTITFSQAINFNTINENNLYITDSKDNIIPVKYEFDLAQPKKIIINALQEYNSLETYTLWIRNIQSNKGKILARNVKMHFKIES